MKLWVWLAVMLVTIGMAPSLCRAQVERAVQLNNVTVDKSTNVLRIRLTTDGPVKLNNSSGLQLLSMRTSFVLQNTRYCVPNYVGIDVYPVSHLEFSVDPKVPQDMRCTLVSYANVRLTTFGNDDRSQSAQGIESRVMITNNSPTEILIQVTLDRKGTDKVFTRATPRCIVSGTRDSLSMQCVNTNLRTVLKELSEATQTPIYLDIKVEPHISGNFEDLPLARMLQFIALGYGLTVEDNGQALFVTAGASVDASSYALGNQRTIPLRYLTPDECIQFLPFTASVYVKRNQDGKSLSVFGSSTMLDKIARDVAAVDLPSYNISFKVSTISCDGNEETIAAINHLLVAGNTKTELLDNSISVTTGAANAEQLLASLTGLITSRKVTIQSAPTIQVLNGETADLFVGQTVYMIIQQYGVQRLRTTSPGTRIRISPRTSSEWINLTTNIENSFVQEVNALGPLISSQKVSSTLRVKSGDTVIVGGLEMMIDDKQKSNIPVGIRGYNIGIPISNGSSEKKHATWVLLTATASQEALIVPRVQSEVLQ